MEAQNIVGNIPKKNYMDLKVFTKTTYSPFFLDEYQAL